MQVRGIAIDHLRRGAEGVMDVVNRIPLGR